eukprot:CAMPEP_0172805058 /NCGR_PEP_ID=MMETSP1075-20121228/5566_1 /TAXON_ID=2916 /ORGANISM="Ceratium fusus, Strain PA161109" /LENGTH=491 /DNA_ID=CAMNT_0013643731 /DNA_START=53 /DNA_END=1528 /DNA_ORIENTATION=-
MIFRPMAAFSIALAIVGSASGSTVGIADERCTSTLVSDEDVDLMGAVSLLQTSLQQSDSVMQDQQIPDVSQQSLAMPQVRQSLFSQLPQVANAAMTNQLHQWQLQQLQQPQLVFEQQQSQQLQPLFAVTPGPSKNALPQELYSAALPQPFSTSQTFDAPEPRQLSPLMQFQPHASMQPQVAQPVPLVAPAATVPASGMWPRIEAAATGKMEQVVALAQSSLAQAGLLRDRLSKTSMQLGEAAQSQQVSNFLQPALEQATRGAIDNAHGNDMEQLPQVLLVQAGQLQQQLHELSENLALVATVRNASPLGAGSALALQIADGHTAKAEAAARTQSAWAQAEQRLQVAARASEKNAVHARAEAQRAAIAEAREHKAELLMRDAQTRERVAEQHELQVESRAGQEIHNLRSMLEKARIQLQESKAELQRTQTAAFQAQQVEVAMQEEAARTAAAQTAQVQAQVAGELQSAESSAVNAGQLIQGFMNDSFPVAVS